MGNLLKQIACPACQREGGDTSANNLSVYDDGLAWCQAGHEHKHGHPDYTPKKGTRKNTMSNEKPAMKPEDRPNIEWLDDKGTWQEKNISNRALTEFGVGVVAESPGTLAFPFYEHGSIVGYQYRDVAHEKKFNERKIWTEGRINLFGLHMLRGADELYITEGLTDALTIYDVTRGDKNRPDVLALPGASTTKYLQSNFSVLRKYKRVYLVPDNDKAGEQLVKNVMDLPGMSHYKTHIVQLTDHKDVTEYRQHGDMFYFWEAARNSKPFAESPFLYNVEQLEDLEQALQSSAPFTTGIDALDHGLGGGIRREEFMGVVGFSGFGKSTFSLFLASQITKLNPEAKVLIVGTEMNYKQNLKALAQMVQGSSWRNRVVTSIERRGAFSSVLSNEQIYLYRKPVDDIDLLLEDIEIGIVEHGINMIFIDVVTDLFPVGDLKTSGQVAKALHTITLGNDERNIPSAAVIGVFHTSGANNKSELSGNKIRGGNAVQNQLTSAIAISGLTDSPRPGTDTRREVLWLKKSREHAPDTTHDFFINWNSEDMTYKQIEDKEDNAKREEDNVQRQDVQEQSRSSRTRSVSRVAVRARDNDATDDSPTTTATPSGFEDGSVVSREAKTTEAIVEDVQQVHAGLSDTGGANDNRVQGVADSSEPRKVPRGIPNLRAVMEGRNSAESEGVGTGRNGTQPLDPTWINVDIQPITKASGDIATARQVPPSYPQEYFEHGMLSPYPTPEERRLYAQMAKGERDSVPKRRRIERAKK